MPEQRRPRDDDAVQRQRVLLPICQARHQLHIAEVARGVPGELFPRVRDEEQPRSALQSRLSEWRSMLTR